MNLKHPLLLLSVLFSCFFAACTAKEPLSLQLVRSEMARNPEPSFIDGQNGRLKWNYTTGMELKTLLDAAPDKTLDYVDAWYDSIIDSCASILTYKKSNFSLDHICPGRTLFQLYDYTGKEKYRAAMDSLYSQIKAQPRTAEGGFWHKAIYPGQMWLDGLYMAQPFYAEYTTRFVTDSLERETNYRDVVRQFELAYEHTWDYATGLLRHAWDSTHEMFWCNPDNGQSDHAWGRAMGWYAMALVETSEQLPQGSRHQDVLINILKDLYDVLPLYADSASGMWYQVLDCPGREGNYLEASASAMFVYAWLKGIRLGYLAGMDAARSAYESLLKTFVTEEDGLVNLNQCCEVAGLGNVQMRRGDYNYYISEPICANDPKGIGPLIWAALEYESL